jgi:uncharacterized OB-fold protein
MTAPAIPATEHVAKDYWRERPDGSVELTASRCRGCGTHFLPRVSVCAQCHGLEFEAATLREGGRLYVYTVIHMPPPGYESPYAIGYVDFPQGVRVFGHVSLDGANPPSIGGPVGLQKAIIAKRADGTFVVAYRFVPLAGDGSAP